MTLTKKHIETIRDFIRSKYVEYYDVEIELLDHLASDLEGKLGDSYGDAELKAALQASYKKFGVYGFSNLVEKKKKKETNQKGRKIFWQAFFEYFKWPQAVLSLLVFCFYYLVAKQFSIEVFIYCTAVAVVVITGIGSFKMYRFKKTLKHDLTSSQFGHLAFAFSGASFNLPNLFWSSNGNFEGQELFWLPFFVTICILLFMANLRAMKKVHLLLEETYPEAFFVGSTSM